MLCNLRPLAWLRLCDQIHRISRARLCLTGRTRPHGSPHLPLLPSPLTSALLLAPGRKLARSPDSACAAGLAPRLTRRGSSPARGRLSSADGQLARSCSPHGTGGARASARGGGGGRAPARIGGGGRSAATRGAALSVAAPCTPSSTEPVLE